MNSPAKDSILKRFLLSLYSLMRRILSITMISIALFALQGGKFAYYLVCKWEAKVILQLKDCDCGKYLSNADDQSKQAASPIPLALKDSSIGVLSNFQFQSSSLIEVNIHCFAAYQSSLKSGFEKISERPPSYLVGYPFEG